MKDNEKVKQNLEEKKHSPTPWEIETPCGFPYTGIYIVPQQRKDFPFHIAKIRDLRESEESKANADLIVRAVNNHEIFKKTIGDIFELLRDVDVPQEGVVSLGYYVTEIKRLLNEALIEKGLADLWRPQ